MNLGGHQHCGDHRPRRGHDIDHESQASDVELAQCRTVVGGDDERDREQKKSPQGHHGAAHCAGQLRQGGVQSLAVERDVALLVGQDPPRHIRSERVVGAIAQRPVITQRHYLLLEHQIRRWPGEA